jgi:hypothetical protein
MLFKGQKDNGRLKFRNWDKTRYKTFLEQYKNGTWFNIKITKAQKPKTLEQLGFHYGVIVPTVNLELINQGHTMTVCGVEIPIDKEQTDRLLKYYCARLDDEGNIVIHDPENHPDRPIINKRDMGKDQSSQFIDNEIKWSEAFLGCRIPEARRI